MTYIGTISVSTIKNVLVNSCRKVDNTTKQKLEQDTQDLFCRIELLSCESLLPHGTVVIWELASNKGTKLSKVILF